jgi:hypothetical protein
MRALKIIVLLALSLALTGCFESIVLLRVNKDGSGTIEETVVISDAFMELMKSFGGEDEGEEEEEAIDEQELTDKAASMGEGVRFVSAEPLKTERGSGYKAIYSFSDINDVRINQNPGENVSPPPVGGEEEGPVEEWLHFNFTGGRTANLEIIYPRDVGTEQEEEEESSGGEADMDSNPEMMQMMRELYKDMHIRIAVEVDGQITETNANYVDGSTVTLMDIDFAKILEDEEKFKELMSADPDTVEEMKELVKDNPGIKVEIEESIQIRFR